VRMFAIRIATTGYKNACASTDARVRESSPCRLRGDRIAFASMINEQTTIAASHARKPERPAENWSG